MNVENHSIDSWRCTCPSEWFCCDFNEPSLSVALWMVTFNDPYADQGKKENYCYGALFTRQWHVWNGLTAAVDGTALLQYPKAGTDAVSVFCQRC